MNKMITVIIPNRPGSHSLALDHLLSGNFGNSIAEVLLSEGTCPSRQRNLAAEEATGEILYFIDDDSVISGDNFRIALEVLEQKGVAAVGGPSLTPPDDSIMQQAFGEVLSSLFGAGGVRNRYRRTGVRRVTDDRELILCNLAVRRDVFMEAGGFNEKLYPNEENEFMDRLIEMNYSIVHDPDMWIERSQRRTMLKFIRQIFTYGRGRAEQTIVAGMGSVASYVPMMFVLYLCFLPFGFIWPKLSFPLLVYVMISICFAVEIAVRRCSLIIGLLSLTVFPVMHIANGSGLIAGFATGVRKKSCDNSAVNIRKFTVR